MVEKKIVVESRTTNQTICEQHAEEIRIALGCMWPKRGYYTNAVQVHLLLAMNAAIREIPKKEN